MTELKCRDQHTSDLDYFLHADLDLEELLDAWPCQVCYLRRSQPLSGACTFVKVHKAAARFSPY